MPFIIVTAPPMNKDLKQKIEEACKDAWASMNGFDAVNGLSSKDVGGVVLKHTKHFAIVQCIGIDRGPSFRNHLNHMLCSKLAFLRFPYTVQVLPSEAEMWFADPGWATKEKVCHRQHVGEYGDQWADDRNRGQLE